MVENVQYVNFTVIPPIVFTVLKYKVYLQTQYFNAIQHGILVCISSPVYVLH